MGSPNLLAVLAENKAIRDGLRESLARLKNIGEGFVPPQAYGQPKLVLLRMAEGLVAAHKAAKHDDDGYTLDLIEDALIHVGRRLSNEVARELVADEGFGLRHR